MLTWPYFIFLHKLPTPDDTKVSAGLPVIVFIHGGVRPINFIACLIDRSCITVILCIRRIYFRQIFRLWSCVFAKS